MKVKQIKIPDEIWEEIDSMSKDEFRPATHTILMLIREALKARKEK